MTVHEEAAAYMGKEAYLTGMDYINCPFKDGTLEAKAWKGAWMKEKLAADMRKGTE